MTDILKHSTDRLIRRLLPQQQILNLPQRACLPIVHKMIPSARVAIKHRRSFHILLAIGLTPITLEAVMGIARCARLVLKELLERIQREMPFDIFSRVNDARG